MTQLPLKTFGIRPSQNLDVSRPVHYLGSKLRIIESITRMIDQLDPSGGVVCDLFAGSGVVAAALARSRPVIAADIQEYSRVLCSALLTPPDQADRLDESVLKTSMESEFRRELLDVFAPLVKFESEAIEDAHRGDLENVCCLVEHGSVEASEFDPDSIHDCELLELTRATAAQLDSIGFRRDGCALVSRFYGGVYFSYRQSIDIDSYLNSIQRSSPRQRDTCLAIVLSTASEVVNTVGKQFAQPIRPRNRAGQPKTNLLALVMRDRLRDVDKVFRKWTSKYQAIEKPKFSNWVYRGDYREVLASEQLHSVSVIYADPPYTRDHYSRYYHVLETISTGVTPEISKVVTNGVSRVSRGIYPTNRHQSPFSIKSKARDAFSELFVGASRLAVPVLVSYSPYAQNTRERPRLLTVDQIKDVAENYFGTVAVQSAGSVSHNKLNSSRLITGRGRDEAEVLIACQ